MSLEVVINGEPFTLHEYEAVTMESIARIVAKSYSLTIGNLKSRSQGRRICRPRQVAMYLIREYFGLERSFQRIADYFCLRDHTTVMHACWLIRDLLEQDAELKQKIEELKLAIGFDSRPSMAQAAE